MIDVARAQGWLPALVGAMDADSEAELAVRRYLTRAAVRFVPAALAIILLITVLVLVPKTSGSRGNNSQLGATAQGTIGGLQTGNSATGAANAGGNGSATAAAGGSLGTAAPGSGGATSSSGGSTGGAASGGATAESSSAGGIARSGVRCGPGVRQVTWSVYAPYCVAAFSGNNGGATSPGVTRSTITVTLRLVNQTEMTAAAAAAGPAISSMGGGNEQQVATDVQLYIDLFEKNFELYGRKIVLKAYTAQGDPIQEYANQGQAGAQTDAATAKDDGAFADISSYSQTQPYAEALASNQIISFGSNFLSQTWYAQHAPYGYATYWPESTRVGTFIGNIACTRLANLPAEFSGETTFQHEKRVFGIIGIDQPELAAEADEIQNALQACGQRVAKRLSYANALQTEAEEDTNIIAQMRAAGVTTILCACDLFSPIDLTDAANNQQYYPEWLFNWWPDPWGRLWNATEMTHAMAAGGATPPLEQMEATRAYKIEDPAGPPSNDLSYPIAYAQVLAFFSALQAAGPDLTPVSFARGFFSLPSPAPAGDFGPWTFGANSYSTKGAFQLGWWSPTAKSGLDGTAGSWQSCNGGTWYQFDNRGSMGPAGQQAACFGK